MGTRLARIALAAFCGLGWGCTAMPLQTITVRVPVAVPCAVQVIPKPTLPVDALQTGADVFEAAKHLWATVEVLEGHEAVLQAAIAVCQ